VGGPESRTVDDEGLPRPPAVQGKLPRSLLRLTPYTARPRRHQHGLYLLPCGRLPRFVAPSSRRRWHPASPVQLVGRAQGTSHVGNAARGGVRVRRLVHGLRRPAGAPDDPAARRATRRVPAADRGFAGGPPGHRTDPCARGPWSRRGSYGPFGPILFTERTDRMRRTGRSGSPGPRRRRLHE
jgi:hypothetical protein